MSATFQSPSIGDRRFQPNRVQWLKLQHKPGKDQISAFRKSADKSVVPGINGTAYQSTQFEFNTL